MLRDVTDGTYHTSRRLISIMLAVGLLTAAVFLDRLLLERILEDPMLVYADQTYVSQVQILNLSASATTVLATMFLFPLLLTAGSYYIVCRARKIPISRLLALALALLTPLLYVAAGMAMLLPTIEFFFLVPASIGELSVTVPGMKLELALAPFGPPAVAFLAAILAGLFRILHRALDLYREVHKNNVFRLPTSLEATV